MRYIHLIVTVGLFTVAWILFRYHGHLPQWGRPVRYDFYVIIGYAFINHFFMGTYNAYMVGHFRIRDLAFAQSLSDVLSITIVYFGTAIAWWQWKNPAILALVLVIQILFNITWSYFANMIYSNIYPPMNAIVLYKDDIDLKQIINLKGKPTDRTFSITDSIKCGKNNKKEYERIINRIKNYDAIFVSGIESRLRNAIAKYCIDEGKYGYFVPHIGDVIMAGGDHVQSFASPIIGITKKAPIREFLLVKRAFDILASVCGLIILSPLLLGVAIAIKLEDHGTVFYKQTRLTKDGKEFQLIKFRSMIENAESDGIARLSTGENDERITKVGRFIRSCRIDEFPQLINIIKGNMTIVGPRPERPEIAEQYTTDIPEFPLRLQVKAGLTGYAQIYGKYNTTPYEKLEFDLMYINNMNILIDLQLMFATARILFSKESTEGIDEDNTTANG